MASLARRFSSRFGGSALDDSGHGRKNISSHLPPLQVDKGIGNNGWGVDKAQTEIRHTDAAGVEMEGPEGKYCRSPKSELRISKRLEELSQLESPLLRELAERLGRMLKIETPRCVKKFEHPYTNERVREIWKEIQGCKNWAGLLEHDFDKRLKAEILRYGEFAQATYDAFDGDKKSEHYGTCKYAKSDLLEKVGLKNRGYEITTFLYATTDIFARGTREDSKHSRGKITQRNDEINHTSERGKDSSENGKSHTEESKKGKRVGPENCKECNDSTNKQGNIESSNVLNGKCKNCAENSKQCNWIGFVAVCTSIAEIARLGRRDIVIAWRGSKTNFDWIADFMNYRRPAGFGPDHVGVDIRVEAGFRHLYTSTNPKSRFCKDLSARDQVRLAIEELVSKYKHEGQLSITLTGHSLGSALATLCAYDIAECQLDLLPSDRTVCIDWRSPECQDGVRHRRHGDGPGTCVDVGGKRDNKFTGDRIPVTVFSFGGPKVGNKYFADRIEKLSVAVLRVVNKRDKVPKVPGLIIHRRWKKLKNVIPDMGSYRHVGVKLKVDNELSRFLQSPAGPSRAHCLEGYLHLVDSYQGIKKDYKKGWIWNRRGCINSEQTTAGDPEEEKTFKQWMLTLACLQHRIVSRFKESKYNKYEKTFRDHALVNKYKDFLKPKYAIPGYWWQEKNKGLVQDATGKWGFPDRDETIPGTEEAAKKELERSIRAARERSRPHENRRLGASRLSRPLTMR